MPVLSGEIPIDGVIDVLREVEDRRTTGVLYFTDEHTTGEIGLVCGQVAGEQQPLSGGGDPVEAFLKLRGGRFEVRQRLPSLPLSRGDDRQRFGSLDIHVPADLMNYCERAGLTGTLYLERSGRLAEIFYDRGELTGIRVDGEEDADLHEVFSWDDGRFSIEAQSEAPALGPDGAVDEEDPEDREPTTQWVRVRRREETGQQFLRVVEMALTSIMEERELRRPASRSSPQLPPMPEPRKAQMQEARKSIPSGPPPRTDQSGRPPTVRIVYVGPHHTPEVLPLDEESPRGRDERVPTKPYEKPTSDEPPIPLISKSSPEDHETESAGLDDNALTSPQDDLPRPTPPPGAPDSRAHRPPTSAVASDRAAGNESTSLDQDGLGATAAGRATPPRKSGSRPAPAPSSSSRAAAPPRSAPAGSATSVRSAASMRASAARASAARASAGRASSAPASSRRAATTPAAPHSRTTAGSGSPARPPAPVSVARADAGSPGAHVATSARLASDPLASSLTTMAWALVVILLSIAAIGLLARLPPVD